MFKKGDKVRFVGDYYNHPSTSLVTGLTLKELCEKYNNIFTVDKTVYDNIRIKEDAFWCFSSDEFQKLFLNDDTLDSLTYALTSQMQNKNAKNLLQPLLIYPADICYPDYPKIVDYEPFWSSCTKKIINNIKGEESMLEILNLYRKAKKENIGEKYQKERNILIENDPLQIMVKETEEQANCLMGKKENEKISFNEKELLITLETKEAIEKLEDECRKEHKELDDKIDQVNALCDIANNYEEKISILKTSKILDKNLNFIL